ncbi:MAG: MFS transporter [Oligoflexia bacterium]|nr:MFS transporter [Oligoflexia bacterium]
MNRNLAIRFIVLLGMVSLFADATYEGARSIAGPYLGFLGASATTVGVVAGLGEFLGYTLRLGSGILADRTRSYWSITIFGYVLNLFAVPLLAFAGRWEIAALLLILERTGRAIRSPVRDAMLSHAAHQTGLGWGFGLHEAMDQTGAMIGPLAVAWALYRGWHYPSIFGLLVIPALLAFISISIARFEFPHPQELEKKGAPIETRGYPAVYWVYLAAASLVAVGYVDFPLIAFHLQKTGQHSVSWIPILYAFAMGVEAVAALAFGWLYDRIGLKSLIAILFGTTFFAPFVFQGGLHAAFIGMALWGAGMGAHDSVMRAAVASWIPAERRAAAYGWFNFIYGTAWFAGSAAMGVLYDRSIPAMVAVSVGSQLLALPFLFRAYMMSGKLIRKIEP